MKPVLLWTPQAREDLLGIYIATANNNVPAAERVYMALERRTERLRDMPRMGVRRPEIAPGARLLVEGRYLILYQTHPDINDGPIESVEIVRLVHGHRDLQDVFEKE